MGFKEGCGCHVWAIDGWTDDATAKQVNDRYDSEGNSILLGSVQVDNTCDAKVAHLLVTCRRQLRVHHHGVLFGGFQNATDGAPEHMWFLYHGFLYDTMPGAPLRRVATGDDARSLRHPPSEVRRFSRERVGRTPFHLTASQYQLIKAARWTAGELEGRAIEYYTLD